MINTKELLINQQLNIELRALAFLFAMHGN
jgi:hypothetical protein